MGRKGDRYLDRSKPAARFMELSGWHTKVASWPAIRGWRPTARPRLARLFETRRLLPCGPSGAICETGRMSPRHSGWRTLAEAVAPGARVTRLRRLTGGAGGTDAYDVALDLEPRRVVVKLYPDGDRAASSEWRRLELAQRVRMPVPEPLAADLESVWFGRPALVIS